MAATIAQQPELMASRALKLPLNWLKAKKLMPKFPFLLNL